LIKAPNTCAEQPTFLNNLHLHQENLSENDFPR
jgi:hypothetical protein